MANVAPTTYKLNPFSTPFAVPPELASRRNWICWRADPDYDAQGKLKPKPKKTPIIVGPGTSFSWQRPENHVSYDEAVAAVQKHGLSGVGFVLTLGCGLIGGDLDKCRNPVTGVIEPWAQAIIDLRETYFEISPSGEGVRFWSIRGDLPVLLKKAGLDIELYSTGHYLTFTGDHIEGTPWDVYRAEDTMKALMKRAAEFKPSTPPASQLGASPGSFEEIADRKAYRESPMGQINEAAMKDLDAWVPELLPSAEKTAAGGYRVKSRDLDRPLEEDLSISLDGIKDFGVHDLGDSREGKRSPIDVVMEWHDPPLNVENAATWLGARVGVPFDGPSTGSSGASPEPDVAPFKPTNPSVFVGRAPPPREWIVKDWIPCGVVMGLYGDGGTGKSLLAQQLQTATALGKPWLGLAVEPVTSLGFYCEDDENELWRRQDAINAANFCDHGDLSAQHWLTRAGEDNILMVFGRSGVGELTRVWARLLEATLDLGARLLVVDTAADTFAGNENDRGQVRQYVQRALGSIALRIGGSVVCCAHPSRAGMATGTGDSGSTGWSNAFRSRAYLEHNKEDRNARVFSRMKANYAPPEARLDLRWVSGVMALDRPFASGTAGGGRRPVEDVFLDLMSVLAGSNLSDKSNANNYAPKVFMKQPPADRQGYTKDDFERAMYALLRSRKIVNLPYGRGGAERLYRL